MLKRAILICDLSLAAVVVVMAACSAPGDLAPVLAPAAAPTVASATALSYQARLGAVERDVIYCTVDEVALKMDVYYPQAMSRPAPIIVYVHGGSWSSGDKSDVQGMADVPGLLARGYLVASVDYRHAPQYEFPAQIEDVKCAIRFLRTNASHFYLDPDRIGAWGHSAGGHLVSLLGTTTADAGFEGDGPYQEQSSRVRAVVDMCGRADLRGMPEDKAAAVFGVQSGSAHLLEHASPITFVSKDDPPFLILHGDKDDMVPLRASEEFYKRLQAAGVPAKLVVVRNADHSFMPAGGSMSPTRAEMTRMVADFFDQYLR